MKQTVLILLATFSLASFSMAQTIILDFETAATSTTFQYFGSTLDGTLSNVIANPDASGINTSAMVGEHVKPANSQVWAGAFSNPNPQTNVDLVNNSMVCMKVWFDQPGSVSLKLENATNGVANWITTKSVAAAQEWTEVCFNANEASLEAPNLPAAGGIFQTVTLFFDFGTAFTQDKIYYFDDVVAMGGGATTADITFSVDMNNYTGTFTTVYVSGTFNNWDGGANPLDDTDGDGVWTATLPGITTGLHEYKFQLDQWAQSEQFNGFETCTITDPSGQFTNRRLTVSADETLPTYCYNSCYACGDAVNITFEVGAGNVTVDPNGLFVAGGGNFGVPGDFPLSDDDLDGIYTITVERQKGFSSFFTFTNGNCPDYSCKEDISGQPCANPGNFNDRFLGPVTQDTTIATCFAQCTDNTDDCSVVVTPATVTFQVDMNSYAGAFTTAYISGTFNAWAGDANPLDDADGDGVYQTTLTLNPGNYEYKFQLDSWAVSEQFMDGDPCTITDPSGQFVNRLITVSVDETVCFEWETCVSCLSNTRDLSIDHSLFSLSPNVTDGFATLYFSENLMEEKTVRVFNASGLLVSEAHLEAGVLQQQIDLSNAMAGLYLVSVQTGTKLGTQRLVRQ